MTRLTATVMFLLIAIAAYTQSAESSSYLHNRTVLERAIISGMGTGNTGSIALPSVIPGTEGTVYLNPDYRNASFMLYENDKVFTGFPAKLDLQRNEFDVLTQAGVRALAGGRVKSFVWSDSLTNTKQFFVNGKDLKDDEGISYVGFFQVLTEGRLSLLKKSNLIFKAGDKSPTHNVGSRDNKFLKETELYYAIDNKALKIPSKKKMMLLFESKEAEVTNFIKINELDLKKENHLQILFEYYNSLTKS